MEKGKVTLQQTALKKIWVFEVMLIMYLTMPIMTVHHMEALPVKNQVTVIQVQ